MVTIDNGRSAAAAAPFWDRNRAATVTALFLGSRALLVAAGAATVMLHGGHLNSVQDWLALLDRWDTAWYRSIAEGGYSLHEAPDQPGATNYNFFPVFPVLVVAVKAVTGLTTLPAGILVANLAFLAALFVVRQYAASIGLSEKASILAVALLAAAPQNIVFSAVYPKSLFVLLLAGAMLAEREQHFWLSGLSAAALSAVRANGIFFVIFAAAHLLRRDGLRGAFMFTTRPERYLPLVLAPAGLLAFLWFSFLTTGDAFAWPNSQREGWYRTIDWPWFTLGMVLTYGDALARYWVVSSLALFAASLLLLKYRYDEEFWFCLACFVAFWAGAAVANSLLRYVIVLFPIYIGMARALEHRPRTTVLVILVFAAWNIFLVERWIMRAPIAM